MSRRAPARERGSSRAPRPGRGRTIVALALFFFVVVGASAVWRRSVGIARARAIRTLVAREGQLAAERASLDAAVRLAAARARVGSVAEERLGMRVPSDTQLVLVSRAGGGAAAPGSR